MILSASAKAELVINQHDGPTECSDAVTITTRKHVKINYKGTIDESSPVGEKGKEFDSAVGREFVKGYGEVIPGLEEGLRNLCEGANVTLILPPNMGYGKRGAGAVPGGARLRFDIEVVGVSEMPFLPYGLLLNQYDGPTDCDDEDRIMVFDFVEIHYNGTIDESSKTGEKGKEFETTRDRDAIHKFQIGEGIVMPGWEKGLIGVCKGAWVHLIIPPELGYREEGLDHLVPPNATLHYDIHVVEVSDNPPLPPNIFQQIDKDGSGLLTKKEMQDYFQLKLSKDMPKGLWEEEDVDGDGFVTWAEFNGPKGEKHMGDEL